MKPVVSVTQRVGAGGIGVSAALISAAKKRRNRTVNRAGRRNLELHRRGFFGTGLGFEIRLWLKPLTKETGDENRGKTFSLCIEGLGRLIESHALDGDAILRSFELHLKIAKILRRFEFGIPLSHNHESRQGGRQPILCLLE